MGLMLLAVIIWAALELRFQKCLELWMRRKTISGISVTRFVWLTAIVFIVVICLDFWVLSSLTLQLQHVVHFFFLCDFHVTPTDTHELFCLSPVKRQAMFLPCGPVAGSSCELPCPHQRH